MTYPETVDQDDRLLDSLLYREEVEEYDPDAESDEADNFSDEDEVW